MERRKFLIGASSAAVGASAVIGSGAFSFVRADRDITVDVVGDGDAYLGLEPTSEYAAHDGNQLVLDFAGGSSPNLSQNGDGLNDNASSRFDFVFEIHNNGTNDARISFHAGTGIGGMPDEVTWYYSDGDDDPTYDEQHQLHDTAGGDLPIVSPGEKISIHVIFGLRDENADPSHLENLETLGIVAEEP